MSKFSLRKLTNEQKKLRIRILELSHKSRLSHLGSCFSSIDLIDAIYQTKKHQEKFILSNGHAGIALYAVLLKYGYIKNPREIGALHIHPDRNTNYGISVSTGSLGQGLPIALGMAIANRKQNVYCMISDGECTEGSIWEALKICKENNVSNLKIVINANGWSAYDKIDLTYLARRIKAFGYNLRVVDGHNSKKIIEALKKPNGKNLMVIFARTTVEQFSFLKGLSAHYYIMNENDYRKAMELLK